MDVLKKSLNQLLAQFKGMSAQGRAIAIGTALALLGAMGAIITYAGTPDYAPLFTSLSDNDSARVMEKLRAAQVPYRLSADGHAISVPWERVPELRVDLASEGTVKGTTGAGLELFERGSFGQTELAEHVTLTRALQGELARTIGGLEPVEHALVHLGRPRPSAFLGTTDKAATASVVLKLKPGRSLSGRQINGIRELVAASVEGLEPSRVSILDASGASLASLGGATNVGDDVLPGLEHERATEDHLTRKAQSLLDQVFGPGKALVRVSARVTREKVEERREKFDPQGIARSETTTTRTNQTKNGRLTSAGVTAGVSTNTPGSSQGTTIGDDSKETEETTTTSYEIGKTTQVVSKEAGTIERLSVGLLLDESLDKTAERVEKIVKEAVGYDAHRGDTFERGTIPFKVGEVEDTKHAFDDAEARDKTRELVREIALGASVLLAALVGFIAVRRPRAAATPAGYPGAGYPGAPTQPFLQAIGETQVLAPVMAGASGAHGAVNGNGGLAQTVAMAPVGPPLTPVERAKKLKTEATRDVEQNPEAAGRLLEEWLSGAHESVKVTGAPSGR